MKPVVVAVAITGSVPRKKDNPAVPILPSEQIESTHAAFEAGVTIVHIHARNDDQFSHGGCGRHQAGLTNERPHVQFVMGVKNTMPADERLVDVLLDDTHRILPNASWTAAGIGGSQATVMEWALARSADAVRTGLGGNVSISKDYHPSSNAKFVTRAAEARAIFDIAA
jgi:uncharacterized protein (DUF849 family)